MEFVGKELEMRILNSANSLEKMGKLFNSLMTRAKNHDLKDFARDFQCEVADWITE